MSDFADKVDAEKAQVAAGQETVCGALSPDPASVSACVRRKHLPDDQVHVGEMDDGHGGLVPVQWPEVSP